MEDMQAAHFNERNNPSLYFKHLFLFVCFPLATSFGLQDLSALPRDRTWEHGSDITEF